MKSLHFVASFLPLPTPQSSRLGEEQSAAEIGGNKDLGEQNLNGICKFVGNELAGEGENGERIVGLVWGEYQEGWWRCEGERRCGREESEEEIVGLGDEDGKSNEGYHVV